MLDALPAHFQPIRRSKVDGLSEVVAVVEPCVVAAGERDHELAGVLVGAMNRDAMSLKKQNKYTWRLHKKKS